MAGTAVSSSVAPTPSSGCPGDGINGFMEPLRKRHDRIRHVHVRHEEVGALAAAG